ncbi:MAG: LON peptidase substrate-binding domain-containing protein [Geodermatophilaceae bacterium]|nr:LON peptidase substrate-binding domain-containing protein [Geodermatophilaceae bacterium]
MSATIPLFPLGSPLFPGMVLPLHVFEERYRLLVEDLLALPDEATRRFGVVAIRQGWEVGGGVFGASEPALYDVGCMAVVRAVSRRGSGRFDVVAVGTDRFKVVTVHRGLSRYLQADVEELPGSDTDVDTLPEAAALGDVVGQLFLRYISQVAKLHGTEIDLPELPDNPRELSYLVAAGALLTAEDRQALLVENLTTARLAAESHLLRRELTVLDGLRAVPVPLVQLVVPSSLN